LKVAILIPIFSYAGVKLSEEGVKVWHYSLPLLLNLGKYHDRIIKLREIREELQGQIRVAVQDLGPQVGAEFWKHRVVNDDQIAHDNDTAASGMLSLKRNKQYQKKLPEQELDEDLFQELSFIDNKTD